MHSFVESIPDNIKSSGTHMKESSCTFLSLNIVDDVKSSGINLKEP